MTGLWVLLRKEVTEQWRTYRLPVVAAVFLMVGISSPLLAFYLPEILERFAGDVQILIPPPTAVDSLDQFRGNLGLVALVAAVLLAMGSVAGEKERGTAAMVLTKPVTRPAFLLAKFGALLVTFAVALALAGAATYIYTGILFEWLSVFGFILACLLLLLVYMVYLTVTLLGSTVMPSALPAAGIGVGAFVIMTALLPIPGIGRVMPAALEGPAIALALGAEPPGFLAALLFSTGVIILALVLAWLSFRRQAL